MTFNHGRHNYSPLSSVANKNTAVSAMSKRNSVYFCNPNQIKSGGKAIRRYYEGCVLNAGISRKPENCDNNNVTVNTGFEQWKMVFLIKKSWPILNKLLLKL